uniref:Uncharacterized protein n=1 Tax=Ciona intestinalis TaxID=7719 RepID=F6U1W2_CIOIN
MLDIAPLMMHLSLVSSIASSSHHGTILGMPQTDPPGSLKKSVISSSPS